MAREGVEDAAVRFEAARLLLDSGMESAKAYLRRSGLRFSTGQLNGILRPDAEQEGPEALAAAATEEEAASPSEPPAPAPLPAVVPKVKKVPVPAVIPPVRSREETLRSVAELKRRLTKDGDPQQTEFKL